MFTRFTETGEASFDQRLHLCRSTRFIYDTVSHLPDVGTTVQRTEGRWRVTSARFARRGRHGRATVRGTPDDGSAPVRITVTVDGNVVRIDGALVAVDPSDLC
jgi:hypothetical protein